MAVNITTANGKTTLTLKYTATSDSMNAMLVNAARALYDQGLVWWNESEPPLPYEQLTIAQKLGLIDAYIKHSLIELHRLRMVEAAQAEAKVIAEAQAVVEMD
jgi:hypothetical protein